jgi:hypothetical protein
LAVGVNGTVVTVGVPLLSTVVSAPGSSLAYRSYVSIAP